jgi:hypothetical protein
MKRTITSIFKSILKSIQDSLLTYVIGVGGFGAVLAGYFYNAGEVVLAIIKSPTSLGVVIVAGILFLILGYLLGKPKKTTKPSLIHDQLVEVGPYKWDVKVYSDGRFTVGLKPYCAQHEMKLVENWPLYLCPLHSECSCQLSTSKLKVAYDQANSIIESGVREMINT